MSDMWWCPCARWCCPPRHNTSEIVLLTGSPLASTTPHAYTVRRISSFGQTIINEKGEEEEVGRHSSITAEQVKEKLPGCVWSSAPSPVQPGVTKSDVFQQLNKMPPISENTLKSKSKWRKVNPIEKKRDIPFTKTKYRIPPSPVSFESEPAKSIDSFDDGSVDSSALNSSSSQKSIFVPAAISASTPNLLCDGTKPLKGPSTPVGFKNKSNWAKSQSLMDVRRRRDEGVGRFSEVGEEDVAESGAEEAARYGLDMSLYRGELRRGSLLPASHPLPTLTITAHFSLDKMLVVEVVGVGGLGGCGPDGRQGQVIVKLTLSPGKHPPTAATNPAPPSANLCQHFSLPVSTLHNLLRLSVFDSDWQTCEHDAIGHGLLELSRVTNLPAPLTLTLSKRTLLEESAGLVQVNFELNQNHLSIQVKGISNLSSSLKKSKLYCKVSYYHDGHKAEEKVSRVVSATNDNVPFNFAVKFRHQPTDQHSYLVIGVKRRENRALRRNPTVGRAYLGPSWWTGAGPKAAPTPWGQAHLGHPPPTLSLKLYL